MSRTVILDCGSKSVIVGELTDKQLARKALAAAKLQGREQAEADKIERRNADLETLKKSKDIAEVAAIVERLLNVKS